MSRYAIVVVGYKRLFGIKRLIASLEKASYSEQVDLIFDIDNSGSNDLVGYAETYNWIYGEKKVRTYPERQGLRPHMIKLGDWFDSYEALIILEDDLIVSPAFFDYSRQSIEKYSLNDRVFGISLYNRASTWSGNYFLPLKKGYDNYFVQDTETWGQIWLKNQWNGFKKWFDKLNDVFPQNENVPIEVQNLPENTYSKYLTTYLVEKDLYFSVPYAGFSSCFADAGEHTAYSGANEHTLMQVGQYNGLALADSIEETSVYDVYGESKNIYKWLGIENADITVSLGNYKRPIHSKYLLTSKVYDYKIVKHYGCALRPVELNVFYEIPGNEIFLYDTSRNELNNISVNKYNNLIYLLGSKIQEWQTVKIIFGGYTKSKIASMMKKKKGH